MGNLPGGKALSYSRHQITCPHNATSRFFTQAMLSIQFYYLFRHLKINALKDANVITSRDFMQDSD